MMGGITLPPVALRDGAFYIDLLCSFFFRKGPERQITTNKDAIHKGYIVRCYDLTPMALEYSGRSLYLKSVDGEIRHPQQVMDVRVRPVTPLDDWQIIEQGYLPCPAHILFMRIRKLNETQFSGHLLWEWEE